MHRDLGREVGKIVDHRLLRKSRGLGVSLAFEERGMCLLFVRCRAVEVVEILLERRKMGKLVHCRQKKKKKRSLRNVVLHVVG